MIWNLIGDILLTVGLTLIAIGMYGLIRYRQLSVRILIAAKVDTVGFITVMLGAMFKVGWSSHALKILLIIIFTIITNPLVTQAIAYSAHISSHAFERKDQQDD